jgi:hypothetical protein
MKVLLKIKILCINSSKPLRQSLLLVLSINSYTKDMMLRSLNLEKPNYRRPKLIKNSSHLNQGKFQILFFLVKSTVQGNL